MHVIDLNLTRCITYCLDDKANYGDHFIDDLPLINQIPNVPIQQTNAPFTDDFSFFLYSGQGGLSNLKLKY